MNYCCVLPATFVSGIGLSVLLGWAVLRGKGERNEKSAFFDYIIG